MDEHFVDQMIDWSQMLEDLIIENFNTQSIKNILRLTQDIMYKIGTNCGVEQMVSHVRNHCSESSSCSTKQISINVFQNIEDITEQWSNFSDNIT